MSINAGHPAKTEHYLGLDLLRGVAAFGVVLSHFAIYMDLSALAAHGYLAVDFFFALSGFVIAKAYSNKLADGRLKTGLFLKMRAIRLLPLVILGTTLAAIVEVGRPAIADEVEHFSDTAIALAMGSFLLPILWRTTLQQVAFPLNGPIWSLFFEAVSNAAFAPCARKRMSLWALVPVMTVSLTALAWGSHLYQGINIGSRPEDFAFGFSRIGWSFSVGVALQYLPAPTLRVSIFVPTVILFAVMMTPLLGTRNEAFDDFIALFGVPLILIMASTARPGQTVRRLSAWAGKISYPLYAIHYPLTRASSVVVAHRFGSIGRLGIAVAGTLAIAGLAEAAYRLYDVPVREWLSRKLTGRHMAAPP